MRKRSLPEEMLGEIRCNIRQLKHMLNNPGKTFQENIKVFIALREYSKLEHQALTMLALATHDDVISVRFIDYVEIPHDRLDEIVTDEYCEEILKYELSQERRLQ